MNRDDFASLAIIGCFALGCVLVGFAVAVTGHIFTEALWHLGAIEEPASWIAYGVACIGWLVIGMSVGGRIINGTWWWRDQP